MFELIVKGGFVLWISSALMCMGTLLIINYMAFLDSSYEKDEPDFHAMAWFFNYMFAHELCFYAYDSLRKHNMVRSIYAWRAICDKYCAFSKALACGR